METTKAEGDFADVISSQFNTLPSLSDYYDQYKSKQKTQARYKTFPCAKAEKPSTGGGPEHITITEYFGWLVLFGIPSSAKLLEKGSVCPLPSA